METKDLPNNIRLLSYYYDKLEEQELKFEEEKDGEQEHTVS